MTIVCALVTLCAFGLWLGNDADLKTAVAGLGAVSFLLTCYSLFLWMLARERYIDELRIENP